MTREHFDANRKLLIVMQKMTSSGIAFNGEMDFYQSEMEQKA
jgi:hypothetical protein